MTARRRALTLPTASRNLGRPYNNLGVSNALLVEALQVESASTSIIGNGLFDVVFRDFGTLVEQATALEASFITLLLGNNDVLIWAGAGGDASLAPGLPVPIDAVEQTYGALLDQLLPLTDQTARRRSGAPRSRSVSRGSSMGTTE